MATLLTNYDEIKTEVRTLYGELLETSSVNKFLSTTKTELNESLESLEIGDNEKALALVSFHSENTKITLAQTFDQAMKIIDLGLKLPKEVAILNADLIIKGKQADEIDAKIDLVDEQTKEVAESVLDRKQKRAPEITILNKQALLIDEQINKLKKDIAYIESQKTSMEAQVVDNRKIKAMDSIGDMIGTLGNGGLVPSVKMFETYFGLNTSLTGQALPGDYTVTKQ